MEHDWHDIEKLLEGGKIDSIEDIKSHWRQIELLVGDTNDIFLQEGALLLSLVLGETDLASEFYANIEGMKMCMLEGMRDDSLPNKAKSLLPELQDRLLRCRKEVQKVLDSGMQGDKRTETLVTQRETLFAQFTAFVHQIPQSRYRDIFKRQGYKCLMTLQECQLLPLNTPEIAAFSKSLKAVAATTSKYELFEELFRVIFTTLRDADESPPTRIASLLAAQCNEILSQHKHLLSPLVVEVLKAQGEAAFKRVSECAADRSAFEGSFPMSDGWLSAAIDSVSSLVHKWWGANVSEEDSPERQGPVTASEIIASVNPALAGTIDYFLRSVQAVLVDIPLETRQRAALQCLLQSERHIVNHSKRIHKGATKSEMETEVKKKFCSHINSLWPFITNNLDFDVAEALNDKYADIRKMLTQTGPLRSLIKRVKQLTFDRRVQALVSFIFALNSLVSVVEGAPESLSWLNDSVNLPGLRRIDQSIWDNAICPILTLGKNAFYYWAFRENPVEPWRAYTCTQVGPSTEETLQMWKDLHEDSSLCSSKLIRTEGFAKTNGSRVVWMDEDVESLGLNFNCAKSFLKRLIDFRNETIIQYCRRGLAKNSPKKWFVPISNHSSGMFTYCVDSGTPTPPMYKTLDEAQAAQLQCRRFVDPPLNSSTEQFTHRQIPPSLVMRNATMWYTEAGGGALVTDTGSDKWLDFCPDNLGPAYGTDLTTSPVNLFPTTDPTTVNPQSSMITTLWAALPWIGSVAAAATVAMCVYQQCRRPHTPTHTLIQQYAPTHTLIQQYTPTHTLIHQYTDQDDVTDSPSATDIQHLPLVSGLLDSRRQ